MKEKNSACTVFNLFTTFHTTRISEVLVASHHNLLNKEVLYYIFEIAYIFSGFLTCIVLFVSFCIVLTFTLTTSWLSNFMKRLWNLSIMIVHQYLKKYVINVTLLVSIIETYKYLLQKCVKCILILPLILYFWKNGISYNLSDDAYFTQRNINSTYCVAQKQYHILDLGPKILVINTGNKFKWKPERCPCQLCKVYL